MDSGGNRAVGSYLLVVRRQMEVATLANSDQYASRTVDNAERLFAAGAGCSREGSRDLVDSSRADAVSAICAQHVEAGCPNPMTDRINSGSDACDRRQAYA